MPLTPYGESAQSRLSGSYGISADAVRTLMEAVTRGGGRQAQFSHPELGGMGQWSAGGMTMVGDMFNTRLQGLVANLCSDIATALTEGPLLEPAPPASGQWQTQGGPSPQGPGAGWWPENLGTPSSTGAQNDLSYAIFPDARRLATRIGGRVTVYDTGGHRIGGVSQQQSGAANWTFTSQFGTVRLHDLTLVEARGDEALPASPAADGDAKAAPAPSAEAPAPRTDVDRPGPDPARAAPGAVGSAGDVFAALEKLGALRDKGILSEEEFAAKKAELLARI
ncbi:SHOCT domain-containing protein [Roseivivax sediminis]|uniref:Short C-terminal domain-containing protein n=1 Tax=Roseivivax sediminis TaxID=936889 RepID=A0A1I1W5H7_9RHOB|nr:SHOCT domain-containing protein [Roseivivax sediminis]SFD88593.1 Short C-terminal domain-containing protein [Roseivivax sediminis]